MTKEPKNYLYKCPNCEDSFSSHIKIKGIECHLCNEKMVEQETEFIEYV